MTRTNTDTRRKKSLPFIRVHLRHPRFSLALANRPSSTVCGAWISCDESKRASRKGAEEEVVRPPNLWHYGEARRDFAPLRVTSFHCGCGRSPRWDLPVPPVFVFRALLRLDSSSLVRRSQLEFFSNSNCRFQPCLEATPSMACDVRQRNLLRVLCDFAVDPSRRSFPYPRDPRHPRSNPLPAGRLPIPDAAFANPLDSITNVRV